MKTNKKVLTFLVATLLVVSFLSTFVFIYNFKNFSINLTKEKAITIAQNVRDGLTAHMTTGTMDKRDLFLNNIASNQSIRNFHLLRAQSVIDQYGKGSKGEAEASLMEQKVLETKEIQTTVIETFDKVIFKASIPYIADTQSKPNCLECHIAKQGDILGVISIDLEANHVRIEGIIIAIKILLIILLILILSILIANHYIKPYIKLFDDLERGISKAYKGDFSYHVETKLNNEAGTVALRLNELSEIYKFKKTIELDYNKTMIYQRIVKILKDKFDVKKFILFEINNKEKERIVIHDTTNLDDKEFDSNANLCRAFRTATPVFSSDFEDICLACQQKYEHYMCLDFKIDETYSLALHIQSDHKNDIDRIKEYIPIMNNYFDMAKPVIESKILMEILKETTLRDPMTTLYNRRFLNEFLDSNIPSRVKEHNYHSILMVDIDFFKKVNDTYGHDVGDNVIKKLAHLMKKHIRDSDMAVRYGGEEFLILLLNSTKEKSYEIAELLRKDFEAETFVANTQTFKKTLSVGIAHYPVDGDSLWKTIKFADEALYVAKNSGRNKIVEFKEDMHKSGENY